MACKRDRTAAALLAEIASRCPRVRAGVDIGFGDPAVSAALRGACGGVWMTVETGPAACARAAAALDPKTVLPLGGDAGIPFDDHQFDVVVIAGALLTRDARLARALVRETHRVLLGGGCLVFAADEPAAFTQRDVYELLRDGFDVVGLRRPAWWKFGLGGRQMTVCARRKHWRARNQTLTTSALPVSPAMLSPRDRKGGLR